MMTPTFHAGPGASSDDVCRKHRILVAAGRAEDVQGGRQQRVQSQGKHASRRRCCVDVPRGPWTGAI